VLGDLRARNAPFYGDVVRGTAATRVAEQTLGVLRGHAVAQVAEQNLPPLGEPKLEGAQRETVTRGMALRNRVPTEVLDGDPRLFAGLLEADVQLGALIGGEALLTPVILPRFDGQSDYAAKRFIRIFNSNSIGLT
jgi:hypothetical protein